MYGLKKFPRHGYRAYECPQPHSRLEQSAYQILQSSAGIVSQLAAAPRCTCRTVFQHDTARQQLIAYAIGLGKIARLACSDTRRYALFNAGRIKFAADALEEVFRRTL